MANGYSLVKDEGTPVTSAWILILANQAYSPERTISSERSNTILFHVHLCAQGKWEWSDWALVKFSEIHWCAYIGHLGWAWSWKAEVFVLSPSAAREPPFYLIKGQIEREQNKLAGPISCKWSARWPVDPLHASLLMPLSRVVCRVGQPPSALSISAKELQIPRTLSLWILSGSRVIPKSFKAQC